jgi:hypothetical protein
MSFKSYALATTLCAASFVPTAQAAVILDPITGGEYSFGWSDGLGPIDSINGTPETEWSLTLATGGWWGFFITDCCASGDEFSLSVGGETFPWTQSGYVDDLFAAYATGFLEAGTYSASLFVTSLASGFQTGEGFVAIVPLDMAPVPLPAGLPLLGCALAILGLGAARRKRA